MTTDVIEVLRRENGSWMVVINGLLISTHATHAAARIAARNHVAPEDGEQP